MIFFSSKTLIFGLFHYGSSSIFSLCLSFVYFNSIALSLFLHALFMLYLA